MARTAGKWLLVAIVILALSGTAIAVYARQAGALLAAIAFFSADASTVNYADVEAGTAQITLSWQTVNTNGQHRLALEAYQQNRWVSIIGANEVLQLTGAKQITVALPQNYGVPTYRLTLKTAQGQVIEQQFVTLPYDAAPQDSPSIDSFSTVAQSIDTNLLVQSNTRLVVSWSISNRPPGSHLRFDQVLPDGSTVNAELTRAVLWVPSHGEGAVVPRPTASKADLVFRLSLINLTDGLVYDTAEISLPVVGNVVQAPPQTTAQQTNTQQTVVQPQNQGQETTASNATTTGEGITTFSAESATVAPGGTVTLNWDAGDAASVELLQTVTEGPTTLYIELPPSGSLTIPVPENAEGATYTLRAQAADGEVSTGEVNVTSETTEGQ
jgi:hypothetical protein